MYEIEFYETGKIKRVSGDSLSPAAVELLISVASGVSRAAEKGVPSAEEEPCVNEVAFIPALLKWHREEILHGRGTKFEDYPDLTGFQKNELALCQLETDYPLPPWLPDFLDWVRGLDAKRGENGEWCVDCGFAVGERFSRSIYGHSGLNKVAFLRRAALNILFGSRDAWHWDPFGKRPRNGLPEDRIYGVYPYTTNGQPNKWYPGGWVEREVAASE